MLKHLRKNTKVIIWAVVIAFAVWGGYSVSSQLRKETMYAGNIFGKNITFQEFNRFYKATQIFSLGTKPTEDAEVLRQETWQALIFSREAKRRKIEVTDDEVRGEVLRLLDKHKIDPANYPAWLRRTLDEEPPEFEDQVREILRIQKLLALLKGPAEGAKAEPEFLSKTYEILARARLRDYQVKPDSGKPNPAET